MHRTHTIKRRTLALAMAAVLAACGGGGAASTPVDPGNAGEGTSAVVTRLTVDPPAGSVTVGSALQLSATALDAAGAAVTGVTVTWSSSAPAIAAVSAGRVTGAAPGSATITASITVAGSARTATAQITVTQAAPTASFTSLALSPAADAVAVGSTLQLTATPLDAGGQALAGLPAATYTSAAPSVASVSAGGVVTGVAAGSTVITASLTANGVTRTATSAITVSAAAGASSATVRGLEHAFSPASVTIAPGGTVTWTMVDDEHDVTWTGAAPAGGNIPKTDRGVSVSRTFATAGTYTYRCARHTSHNETGTVIVQGGGAPPTTTQPVFTSLTLAPGTASVAVAATAQLTATPRDQNGAPMTGLPAATYTSAAPSTATVSGAGVVTGVAAGSTTITATLVSGGVTRTATATVTVTAAGTTTPSGATVTTPGTSFTPPVVTIGSGGTVTWDISGATHNVTFTGAAPAGGSVPDTRSGTSVSRQFTTPGSYDYVCTRHSGMQGRVVVQ